MGASRLSIPIISRASNIIKRHWADRRHYRRARDWFMSIYNRMLIHMRRMPLPGRGRIWTITPAGVDRPIYLRLATSDWYVMEEIFFTDEYGPLVNQKLQNVRTVVDLGSNIGMSIRLWQKLWPDARVVGVEPDKANLAMAQKNAQSGGNSVTLFQSCVAGYARTVHLDRSRDEYGFRMTDGGTGENEAIEALTVPQILAQVAIESTVDLLKCDVEGAEAEIFANCAEWIGRCKYLAVEVHAPYTADALLADLKRANASPAWQQIVSKGDIAVVFLECAHLPQNPAIAAAQAGVSNESNT